MCLGSTLGFNPDRNICGGVRSLFWTGET
jgi:hypothetical protein